MPHYSTHPPPDFQAYPTTRTRGDISEGLNDMMLQVINLYMVFILPFELAPHSDASGALGPGECAASLEARGLMKLD